jgi:hypothetical protein
MGEAKGSGEISGSYPSRVEDYVRHLDDLRRRTYEGAKTRQEREAVFARAVELLSPVVRRVLEQTNVDLLENTGEIHFEPPRHDEEGGVAARWTLSWPAQRAAERMLPQRGGPVPPVQVVAAFHSWFTHGHLQGAENGWWPMQVSTPEDAERQEAIIRAIVEMEVHQRIFDVDGDWHIIPLYGRLHPELLETKAENATS